MPRVCTVCSHEDRAGVDSALLEGATFRTIADRFGLSQTALKRHKSEHMPQSLLKAQEAAEVAHGDTLLEQIRAIQGRTLTLLDKAEGAGDLRTALSAIRETRGNLELLAKLAGDLDERPQTNVFIDARGYELIIQALEPYAEAKYAVARAIGDADGHG